MKIKLPPTHFLIGRDPRCHLRPASTDVSRHHCAIACRGPVVQLCDLKSENGTFLNDQPVSGTIRVQDGDILRVGSLSFKFFINVEPEDQLPTPAYAPGGDEGSWLVRDPSDDESKALDPALDTSILPSVVEGGVSGEQGGDKNVSAVAGEFFREYMEKGKSRRRRRES